MSKKRPVKAAVSARKPAPNHGLKLAAASLDRLQVNVLIANLDFEVVYINDCAKQSLDKIAGEIRRVFGVDVNEILGSSIRKFQQDHARVEKILASAQDLPREALFTFGDITLETRINSVSGSNGEALGYVVAWEDVTCRQRLELDNGGQIAAIQRSQAVIEFELDGTIIHANEIFLKTMGYSLDEIKGQRHSLFVDESTRSSSEYRDFWQRLNRGEFISGEFRRLGKGGREIFIQGTYSPVLDKNGKPFKIVKFATDVTAEFKR
jgi:methyl-accepting chemotaxis protein